MKENLIERFLQDGFFEGKSFFQVQNDLRLLNGTLGLLDYDSALAEDVRPTHETILTWVEKARKL